MDGGSGDDTFTVTSTMGDDGYPNFFTVGLSGGEGADVFDLTLELVDYEYGDTLPDRAVNGRPGIVIQDFTHGEDLLTIQIDRSEDGEDRDMTAAEIMRDTQGCATLVMSFAATATQPAVEATKRLGTNPVIALDDIAFIQN